MGTADVETVFISECWEDGTNRAYRRVFQQSPGRGVRKWTQDGRLATPRGLEHSHPTSLYSRKLVGSPCLDEGPAMTTFHDHRRGLGASDQYSPEEHEEFGFCTFLGSDDRTHGRSGHEE